MLTIPNHMISDNGTTFISAAGEIQKLYEDMEVNTYLASHNDQWTFIPKLAPWFGYFYERLIGITKNTLKKV